MLADGLGGYLLGASLSLGVVALLLAVVVEIPILALAWRRWSVRLIAWVVAANAASALFALVPAIKDLTWPMPGHDADPWVAAHTWWWTLAARAGSLLLLTFLIELAVLILLTWKSRNLTTRRLVAGTAAANLGSYVALCALIVWLPPHSDSLAFEPDTTWAPKDAGRVWFVEPQGFHVCSIGLNGESPRTEVPYSVQRGGWYLESYSTYAWVPAEDTTLFAGEDGHWHTWRNGVHETLEATTDDVFPMRYATWSSLQKALVEIGIPARDDPKSEPAVYFTGTQDRLGVYADSARYEVHTSFSWFPGWSAWGITVRDRQSGEMLRWGVKAGLHVLPCRDPVIVEDADLILFRCGGWIMVLDPQARRIGPLARGDSVLMMLPAFLERD